MGQTQSAVQGKKTLNGQIRVESPSTTAKKPLSEADSKDPWKKGGNLFSLESLSSKDKTGAPKPTGQKIPLSNMGQQQVQYSNLRMGNSPMGGNMGNMNMGGNMGDMNMMRGNMGGNMSNMGGNMGGNMGNM